MAARLSGRSRCRSRGSTYVHRRAYTTQAPIVGVFVLRQTAFWRFRRFRRFRRFAESEPARRYSRWNSSLFGVPGSTRPGGAPNGNGAPRDGKRNASVSLAFAGIVREGVHLVPLIPQHSGGGGVEEARRGAAPVRLRRRRRRQNRARHHRRRHARARPLREGVLVRGRAQHFDTGREQVDAPTGHAVRPYPVGRVGGADGERASRSPRRKQARVVAAPRALAVPGGGHHRDSARLRQRAHSRVQRARRASAGTPRESVSAAETCRYSGRSSSSRIVVLPVL